MADFASYEPGVPCWIDLGTTDAEATAAFYGGLFGWETADMGGGYRLATLRGKAVAGLGPSDGPPMFWTTYFSVADAVATTAQAKTAGATVLVEPGAATGPGISAMFQDPSGAPFSIWQPLEFPGCQIANEPGTLAWNELSTPDLDGALNFYTDVFPWVAAIGTEGAFEGYVEWKVDGRSIAGGTRAPKHEPAGGAANWIVTFLVEDVDASVALAGSLGGTPDGPPVDVPGLGRFARTIGPHGERFDMITFS